MTANNQGEGIASILAHFQELRVRLLICAAAYTIAASISYIFAQEIFAFLVKPLADITEGEQKKLIYTGLAEAFFTYIKIALFTGFIISFPVFAAQLYRFIAPGLFKQEKKIFLPFLILAPLLFLAGAAIAYWLIFPLAWQFFLSFESHPQNSLPIIMEARVSEYLSLSTGLILGFGLAFQLPVILLMLVAAGVITPQMLTAKRKYAIVLIFILAAILTPPDVVSQISLAIPMLVLYELAVFFSKRV